MNIYKKCKYKKSMKEHYKNERDIYKTYFEKYKNLSHEALDKLDFERDINQAANKELRFKNMKVEYLLSVLHEIESFTDDILVKWVIKNSIKRHNLDTLIHTKLLFSK